MKQFFENNAALIYKVSLVLVCGIMVGMSFWFGISGDEVDMNEYGKAILKFYTSFGGDETVFNMPDIYDRDHILKYYGGFYDTICAVITPISPFEVFTTRHILNALMGFIAIFFTSKITQKLFGNGAAVLAIWLMFLSPFFLGHAMNNPKDIPFAAFYIMAVYGIIRLFEKLPNATKKDYAFAILPIGFAMASRIGGLLLIPEMFVFVFLLWFTKTRFQGEKISLFSYIKPLAIVSVLGYLAACLFWPFGLIDPLNNPLFALQQMTNLSVGMKQVFEGVKIFSTEFPTYYLPKMFTITNTFAVLIGLLVSIIFLWKYRKNKNAAILYFIFFTALFPFFYIIYSKSNVFHAWRHTLFIFPSVIVCATFGWISLQQLFEDQKIKLVLIFIPILLLLEPLVFIAKTFPNTNTYYNAIVGGTSGAYGNYEVDFYYNGLKESADWFVKNELPKHKNDKDSLLVVTNAIHILPYYFPKDAKVKFDYIRYRERNLKDWDVAFYHLALIPEEDIKNKTWIPNQTTLYKTTVEGNALAAVIKRTSKDDIKGMQFFQANQLDSALIYLNNYLKADPANTSILNNVANIYLQKNNIAEAEKLVNQSNALQPNNVETQNMQAMIKMQKNDFAGALSLFQNVITQAPEFVQAYYYMGICLYQTGRYQDAINILNSASQDERIRPMCYKTMGDCFSKMGNAAEAQRFYQMSGMQ